MTKKCWTIERIVLLSKAEIQNLRANATQNFESNVVAMCDRALQTRLRKPRNGATSPSREASMKEQKMSSDTVSAVASLILDLPPVDNVPNGLARLALQSAPVTTLGDLWRTFVVCGFSSLENCEPGKPLSIFLRDKNPLLDLTQVLAKKCDPDWVEHQIRSSVPRMWNNKKALIFGAYVHFNNAGLPTASLKDLRDSSGALKLFCDLARGDISDRDIVGSQGFSETLDPSPFPSIGNKQLRNILVNSGLAHNVVPLDSRWKNFFQETVTIDASSLSRRPRYIAIENVLRAALASIQDRRPDICNLAVLDAIVFAEMSNSGATMPEWEGTGAV